MRKIIISALALFLIAGTAFATPGKGGCTGTYQGKKISFTGFMGDINYLDTLTGSLEVDGREVTRFEGRDVALSFLSRTFVVKNDQGDYAEGKLSNPIRKTGVIRRLSVPAYGIEYRDIPMSCWSQF